MRNFFLEIIVDPADLWLYLTPDNPKMHEEGA